MKFRHPELPELVTRILAEEGLSDRNVPSAVIQKLNSTLNDVLNDADVKKRLDVMGVTASPGTPAAYGDQIKTDLARYADVVKATQIKSN